MTGGRVSRDELGGRGMEVRAAGVFEGEDEVYGEGREVWVCWCSSRLLSCRSSRGWGR